MKRCISKLYALSSNVNPKVNQWLWFIGLWLLGLASVIALSLPIKLLVKACQ